MASPTCPPRSLRPQARLKTFLTEAERPRRYPLLPWRRDPQAGTPSEKARRHKSDAHVAVFQKYSGVRWFHSTWEAGEQNRHAGSGVRGGKGTTRGSCRAIRSRAGHSAGHHECFSASHDYGAYRRQRLDRSFPREEPYAVVPLVRICAGGGQQWPSLPRY